MDSLKGTLTPMRVLQGTLNGGIAYGTFNYNDLENKPSVNGHELVGNVNIPIPTKTSDLTNDSGFITDADVPTKTSDLTNDSGFITDADIPTKTSELTNDSGFITSADIPTIPTNTSQLNNDSGFLTMNTTPVRSVNSQTGDVNLFIPNATSQLNNDAGFVRLQDLSADNIPYDSENSIAEKVAGIEDDIEANTQAIEVKNITSSVSVTSSSGPISNLNVSACYISASVVQLNIAFTLAEATTMDIIKVSGVKPILNTSYSVTGTNNELIAGTFYTDGNISIRRVTSQATTRNYEISLVFIKAPNN